VLRITRAATLVTGSPQDRLEAREQLRSQGFLKIRGLLDPPVLAALLDAIDRTTFYRRVHGGIGVELCAESGAASGALEFLLNDAALRSAVAELAGCGSIGCFEGRIYCIVPGTDHHDSWHSDVGQDRLLALSVNLGREPFDGGVLQLRPADSPAVLGEVDNPTPGDAVLFRIDPALRHRVGAVTGRVARTAYAGWFRAQPAYRDLLERHLSTAR